MHDSSSKMLTVSSRNPHKLMEIRAILSELEIGVQSAQELGIPEVEETGATYLDNALLKATAAFEKSRGLCLADDSGLCVDALDGAPGVYSARFAGVDVSYADNNRYLLDRLGAVPVQDRGAEFVCCLALLVPSGYPAPVSDDALWSLVSRPDVPAGARLYVIEGRVRGWITAELRGAAGFGYDPLFYYPPASMTFAELASDEKNRISHRARALRGLRACLEAVFSAA